SLLVIVVVPAIPAVIASVVAAIAAVVVAVIAVVPSVIAVVSTVIAPVAAVIAPIVTLESGSETRRVSGREAAVERALVVEAATRATGAAVGLSRDLAISEADLVPLSVTAGV
ncbi:MAG: hypothetical protein WBQ66_09335, partial [Blastocatellia bacterium]